MSKIRYQSPNTKKVLNCFMIIGIHPNCSLRVVDLLEFLVKIGSFFFALMWCFFRTKSNNFISVICKNWFICLCEPFSGLNLCNFCKNPKEKEQNIKKKSALMLLFYQPATMAARLLHVKSENNYTLSLFFFVHVFEGASASNSCLAP